MLYSNGQDIRIATASVLDVFNDIYIKRGNKKIKVSCIYGDRSRVLKSLENKNKVIELPAIAISMNNFNRADDRKFDINESIQFQTDKNNYNPNFTPPLPINITYEMEIMASYMEDIEQILGFMPFFSPTLRISRKHPKFTSRTITSRLLWDGGINLETSSDVSPSEPFRIIGTTSFIFHTWFFPGEMIFEDNGRWNAELSKGVINSINFNEDLLLSGEAGYRADRFWAVDYADLSFDEFIDNIEHGYVDPSINGDFLAMSGGLSSEMSGYWHGISAILSSELDSVSASLSGNPYYHISDETGISILHEAEYLPNYISALTATNENFWSDYYYESLTGTY